MRYKERFDYLESPPALLDAQKGFRYGGGMRRRLINLTRFGDLLQTQPVIHAFKEQGEEVVLLCLENFVGAAELLNDVAQVEVLPSAAILSGLESDWRLCVNGLAQWLDGECTAETMNLTPTSAARLLSRLLQAKGQAGGFSLDEHGFGTNGNPWGTYTQAATLNRGCSPFNLVDCFRHMAGVGECSVRYELRKPDAILVQAVRSEIETLGPKENFVAFQLGASNNARRWPTEFFAELGQMLQEKGLTPLLLGSAQEADLAERYYSHGGVGVNFMGRTDPIRLAAALMNCRLLVTNDTGTMHLAAGLGLPLIAIFLATAQAWDTGPYSENSCCLEPRLDCHPCAFGTACPHDNACRHTIKAATVGKIVQEWLKSGRWSAEDVSGSEANAEESATRVWQTTRDVWGFLGLEALSKKDTHCDRTAWIHIQRNFYRQLLDALDAQNDSKNTMPAPAHGEMNAEESGNADEAAKNAELVAWAQALTPERRGRVQQTLANADAMLLLITEQARLLTLRPLEKTRQTFLANCDRLATLLVEHSDFIPLSHLWRSMLQDRADNWNSLISFLVILRNKLGSLSLYIV